MNFTCFNLLLRIALCNEKMMAEMVADFEKIQNLPQTLKICHQFYCKDMILQTKLTLGKLSL